MIGRLLKPIARTLLGDYAPYVIYRYRPVRGAAPTASAPGIAPLAAHDLAGAALESMRDQAWYGGDGARLYGASLDGRLVGTCAYWYGERYASRGFWPLRDGEAKLVQIFVDPCARGRGLATRLIVASAADMRAGGFRDLYARVWITNDTSRRAFVAAGWKAIAVVVEIHPLGGQRRVRIRLPLAWRAAGREG